MGDFSRILVTSALPYANGAIHFGHLAGAYLPADIYVRYQRLLEKDVLYICGSDEHGVSILISAAKENVTPRDIIDRYHEQVFRELSPRLEEPDAAWLRQATRPLEAT